MNVLPACPRTGVSGLLEALKNVPQTRVLGPREWVQVKRTMYGTESGWIPRDVLEGMGIDCSSLNAPVPAKGAIWFNVSQSEAIHKHPEWEPTEGERK